MSAATGLASITAARLTGLPCWQGSPVPFVASWGCRKETVPDPMWGWVDNCDCRPGTGTPHLGEYCPARQRRSMAARLCQMCGQPFAAGEAMWFLSREGLEWHRDPPWHTGCGRFAFTVCPALTRHRDAPPRQAVAGVASYDISGVLRGDNLPAPRAAVSEQRAVKWVCARLHDPVLYDIDAWLTTVTGKG